MSGFGGFMEVTRTFDSVICLRPSRPLFGRAPQLGCHGCSQQTRLSWLQPPSVITVRNVVSQALTGAVIDRYVKNFLLLGFERFKYGPAETRLEHSSEVQVKPLALTHRAIVDKDFESTGYTRL